MYGNSVVSADETLLGKFKKAAAMIAEAGDAGGTIIDVLPARQHISYHNVQVNEELMSPVTVRHVPMWFPAWFPGVAVKRHALEAHGLIREIMNVPVEELRTKRVGLFQLLRYILI